MPWTGILQFIGAAAGFVVLLTLVGRAVLRVRLDALGLPADRLVAELPEALLTNVGLQSVLAPAAVALAAAVLILSVRPEMWSETPRRMVSGSVALLVIVVGLLLAGVESLWALVPAAVLAFAVGAWPLYGLVAWIDKRGYPLIARLSVLWVPMIGLLIVAVLSFNLDWVPHLLLLAIASLVAAAAIIGTVRRTGNRAALAAVVAATFICIGAGLSYARTSNAPKLEPVAVLLKEPSETVAGFYIGESGDRIYVAELRNVDSAFVPAEAVETVVAVDRARVVRMLMRAPASVRKDEGGRGEAQALAAALRPPESASEKTVVAAPTPAHRAAAFAPLLHLHPDDRSAPTSADFFLAHSSLKWKHPRCGSHPPELAPPPRRGGKEGRVGTIAPDALGEGRYSHRPRCEHREPPVRSNELTRPNGAGPRNKRPRRVPLSEGFVLDLDDRFREPSLEARTRRDGAQAIFTNRGAPTPVYWEEHDAGSGRKRMVYWFFYPLSIPPGTEAVGHRFAHEGDWEGMSVLLAREGGSQGRWAPESVRFNAHHTPETVPWSQVEKATDAEGRRTHPVGYVARDSHATYRSAGRFEQTLPAGDKTVIRVDDVAFSCPDCPVWITWLKLRNATEEGWYGFGGAWGQVSGSGDATGPLGPSEYRVDRSNPEVEESLRAGAEPLEGTAEPTVP